VGDFPGKVLVFLKTSSGSSPVGVLFPVEKKDEKEVFGLKASLQSSGGFWPSLRGALSIVRGGGEVGGSCQGADSTS
jgi:hypothetical protein